MKRSFKYFSFVAGASALAFASSGCAESSAEKDSGPSFNLNVAPLELEGIGRACYDVLIQNGSGDTVVFLEGICSNQYGNGSGGSIAYVAPCDADDNDNTVTIWPSLWERQLDGTYSALTDWMDPCEGDSELKTGGCSQTVECLENKDVLVQFDLTIMRNAKQGFFDIAINFNDIFCSAKLDSCTDTPEKMEYDLSRLALGDKGDGKVVLYKAECENANLGAEPAEYDFTNFTGNVWVEQDSDGTWLVVVEEPGNPSSYTPIFFDENAFPVAGCILPSQGNPINLLHNSDGTRAHTAIAAMSCTAGIGSGKTTKLLFDPSLVMCANAFTSGPNEGELDTDTAVIFPLNLDGPEGNASVTVDGTTLHYARYYGQEELECGDEESCNKLYYNLAINLEDISHFDACGLFHAGTAFEDLSDMLGDSAYPIIIFGNHNKALPASLFDPEATGESEYSLPFAALKNGDKICLEEPLNGEGSAVRSQYIQPSTMADMVDAVTALGKIIIFDGEDIEEADFDEFLDP